MKDLHQFLATKAALLTRYVKDSAMVIIGVEARNHFREGFRNEGFTDAALEPWQEVKRRQEERLKRNKNGSISKRQPREQMRKILTDTNAMRDSIHYKIAGSSVEVGTDDDKDKVLAHNEGTSQAGRNNDVTIPKRQFIGESKQLSEKIENRFEQDITKFLQS